MRKILTGIIFILISIQPVYAKSTLKFDSESGSFMELGAYAQNKQSYEEEEAEIIQTQDEEKFEDDALLEVAKRYEANAVELKLDDINDDAIDTVNNSKLFKLQVNESRFKTNEKLTNENMIWDSSKSFAQAVLNDSRHLAPIPSVVNSQKIGAQVSSNISASMGQTKLFDSLGPSVLFVRTNESNYNTGSVISYKGDALNLSVGSFSSSYNNASSGGAVITSSDINLPNNAGSFVLGSALFSKEEDTYDKTTGGLFGEYSYKRLKLNAQVGQSRYTNTSDADTSLYLIPEFKISDSIYLKTRFINNVTQENRQDELALTFKPKKSNNNLEFEINASRQYDQTDTIKQRIKFSTSFRF